MKGKDLIIIFIMQLFGILAFKWCLEILPIMTINRAFINTVFS